MCYAISSIKVKPVKNGQFGSTKFDRYLEVKMYASIDDAERKSLAIREGPL